MLPDIPHPTEIHVGGTWRTPTSNGVVEVRSAATEEVVARLPDVTIADADEAVRSARAAFDSGPWPTMALDARIDAVRRFRAALDARTDDLITAWVVETGVPVRTARRLTRAAWLSADDALELVATIPFAETRDTPLGRVELCREPIGPTVAIVTYNGPHVEVGLAVIPALLVGNPVVVKLPPETRMTGHFIAQAAADAQLPAGVLSVFAADADVARHLVAHPDVDAVHFTGGTAIGGEVAAACAKRIARVTLELGGKSAAIVADDADLDTVVPHLVGSMATYQGQTCVALTRVLVSRARHDELVGRLVDALTALRIGDPLERDTDFGPLAGERVRARAEGYIERAVAAGARVATGGRRPPGRDRGYFLEPTLLVDVDNDMEVAQDEIFGPVYCVIPYDDIDDAVRIANDSRYGLAGAIFTQDLDLAREVARRVRTGSFAINAGFPCLTAPFGGVKQSGYGREGGIEGLLELTNLKAVVLP
jgi:acyl-CoA reductase-like NAD-dependent aldehyde dehydrogenase